jgi:xanthine dehydrogenase/oxidase
MALRLVQTASVLQGKPWTRATYEVAVQALRQEIGAALVPMPDDGVASEYRAGLAESLFFKYFVYVANQIAPQEIPGDEKSAGQPWVRPISHGQHGFVQAPYYSGEPLASRTSDKSMGPGTAEYARMRRAAVPAHIDSSQLKSHVIAKNAPSRTPDDHAVVNISARAQATGEARYTQDLTGVPGLLHAAYVYSTCQNGVFFYGTTGLDEMIPGLRAQWPGFVDYITEADVPCKSDGDIYNDADPGTYDPIFASGRVTAYGQPIGLVVADTLAHAKSIARQIQASIRYDVQGTPVIRDIKQALAQPNGMGILQNQPHIGQITGPESDTAWLQNPGPEPGKVFVTGIQHTGGQAHFYLETQTTLAIPGEMGQMVLYSSSQHLAGCQQAVATALNLHASQVEVRATRLGGGYGGKEVRPPVIAAAAAVAAWKLNRPVRLALDRNTDMTMIGGRHPFKGKYYLSADPSGRIEKVRFDFWSNAGFSYDCSLPVMDLVLLSADGAYKFDTFQSNGTVCRTNMATNTAFRSFGVIQCSLILEDAIEQLAHQLGMTPEAVRELNLYQDATMDTFDLTPYGQELRFCRIREVWADLKEHAKFEERSGQVEDFNAANRWRKRGLAMTPIKYGISYTYMPMNQGSAEVLAYTDGSVLVHHGGVEMGQGIDTKILQITAETLGIPAELIQIDHTDTYAVPNAVSTGASTGTDLQGGAVRAAAKRLRRRLVAFCRKHQSDPDIFPPIPPDWKTNWAGSWKKIVSSAYNARVDLSCEAKFDSSNLGDLGQGDQLAAGKQMFYYFTYSAAVSEVEIDVLTGEFSILRSDIIYDAGQSINPTLDVGQVQGGFIQGVGNVTTEQMYYDEDGKPYSDGTWNYKPPCSKTIPVEFNASLLEYVRTDQRTGTPMDRYGIMSSKSTGEPPLVLANSVFFAIKHAVMAARQAAGWQEWFELESPATVERIRQACWLR